MNREKDKMEVLLGNLEGRLGEKEEVFSDDLVSLINFSIKPPVPVEKEKIFIRAMFLVSDQVNSYGGCFPSDEHPKLASLLIDTPVLIGHKKDKLPIARNFKADLVNKDGANWIKVWFYWLKSSEGAFSLKENIDHGIYKECSIGFSFEFPECSICGEDMRRCQHIPFKSYPDKEGDQVQAHFNYRKINKVLETSLVYRGAIPNTSISNELLYQKHDCEDGVCKFRRIHREVVEGALKRMGLENEVKLVGGVKDKGYSDHDIDLICSPEFRDKILFSLPTSYRDRVHFVEELKEEKKKVTPLVFVPPTKPEKSKEVSNEFFHLDDFSSFSQEFIIEPKYDGVRAQVHRLNDEIKIFTDERNQIQDKFPSWVKSLLKDEHLSFILDGEIVKYKGRTRLSHKDVAGYIQRKDDFDDSGFRYKVFDILFLDGKDLNSFPLEERKQILSKNFEDNDFLHRVKFEKVKSSEIGNEIKKMATSEGAMVKRADSGYFDSFLWFKWKREYQLDVLVIKVVKNKGGTFNYLCAVGSRENPIPIGTTYSTNIEAEVGEILRVKVDYVTKDEDGFSWYAPSVLDKRGDKKEPDPVSVPERMIKTKVRDLSQKDIDEGDEKTKNRFVLRKHWWGEAEHHDLRFERGKVAVGLTLFELDLEGLNRGKRFLCEWKDYHNLKWLDFEGDIPPASTNEDVEGNPSKNLVAHMRIVDRGNYQALRREADFSSFKIEGRILNGIYLVRKVLLNGKERWLFWKSEPPTVDDGWRITND
jgi:hypothetical protein